MRIQMMILIYSHLHATVIDDVILVLGVALCKMCHMILGFGVRLVENGEESDGTKHSELGKALLGEYIHLLIYILHLFQLFALFSGEVMLFFELLLRRGQGELCHIIVGQFVFKLLCGCRTAKTER